MVSFRSASSHAPFATPRVTDLLPMLLGERPMAIDHPGWIYETRFEGWRVLAEFGSGACELRTKSNGNATRWFPEISQSLARVEGGPHVVDGVLCVFDEQGHSDAGRMQARGTQRRWVEGTDPTIYCVFDLLIVNGRDIRLLPLIERKSRLAGLWTPAPTSTHLVSFFETGAEQLLHPQFGPEGLVAKKADSIYQAGVRSLDWVKIKRT